MLLRPCPHCGRAWDELKKSPFVATGCAIHASELQKRPCYNQRLRQQGRSSVVEQRPFKPKVVGSIPTAPTMPNKRQVVGHRRAVFLKNAAGFRGLQD
jgi:hypothetical protein